MYHPGEIARPPNLRRCEPAILYLDSLGKRGGKYAQKVRHYLKYLWIENHKGQLSPSIDFDIEKVSCG